MSQSGRSPIDFQREVHRYIDEISTGLLDSDKEDISEALEENYGIDFYPIEERFQSGNKYTRASFGLSGILAQNYSSPNRTFFDNQEENFTEFIEEIGSFGSGYDTKHLIQYARLYSEIADEEDIEFDHPVDTLLLKDAEEARDSTLTMFEDLSEKL